MMEKEIDKINVRLELMEQDLQIMKSELKLLFNEFQEIVRLNGR